VWHGDEPFTAFAGNVGRFVSEYGFQSWPDSAMLAKYIDPQQLHLGSPALRYRQRSYKMDAPTWKAVKRELGEEPKTLGRFITDSQAVQAKAYQLAIEAQMAARPRCMGTLFWQLNDCWPGPSWSLIDHDGKWKPGMYAVQRLYAH
jgi:beta-mannosidase